MAEFASNAKGNAALATGIIGTAGFGINLLSNLMGMTGCNQSGDSGLVNRYELGLTQEIAAKDGKIALLEADAYTNQKITETTAYLMSQINGLADEVRQNYKEQQGINTQQAVYNGTMTATASCIQSQVAQLMALTKLVVPNSSVCPGWGNVTVTPATTTTTTTPAA